VWGQFWSVTCGSSGSTGRDTCAAATIAHARRMSPAASPARGARPSLCGGAGKLCVRSCGWRAVSAVSMAEGELA
jgi:hypothetical protein